MSCPRCELQDFGRAKRPDGIRHRATEEKPELEELMDANMDGVCPATDGCTVEPDGHCEHGHSSWLLALGMI